LKNNDEFSGAKLKGLKFVRGTIRDYIFILHDKHKTIVDTVFKNIMGTNWNKHFSELNI
jgi:hypothetical protein